MNLSLLGTVQLSPLDPIVAGSLGTWTLTYTIGALGIDEGGTIKLAKRFASDWEKPQFDRPAESGYTTIDLATTGPAKLAVRFQKKAHDRPWMNWCIVLDCYDGSLSPGDIVTIVLGDTSQGSPGIRAQTFIESAHDFRIFADPTNAAVSRPVPTSPTVPIIPGPAIELVCILPTTAVIGQPIPIHLKGQDQWMNPTPPPKNPTFSWEGTATAEINDNTLTLLTPGTGHVTVDNLTTRSNPLTVSETAPALNKYWGDLHAQSDATVGTGTEEEYFTFCRDQAFADIASHQGNDFQMTDEDWSRLNDVVEDFNTPGSFVVLPGYEWSANTPAGGDRNVFYSEPHQPIFRSSHWQIPEIAETDATPAHPASELFERIRANGKGITAAHVGGRYADIKSYFDQDVCPLVEVLSCWGIFEWMLWDAFDEGYVVGVMANSDGHKGRPGAEGPGAGDFGIAGGLTCVLSKELTRPAIFDALKNRHCYGTSGPRIDLDFTIDGHPMGSVIEGAGKTLQLTASAKGTAPLESLLLYQGKEIIETARPETFTDLTTTNRIRLTWQGARMRGRGRRIDWSGTINVEGARILSATTVAFDSPADGLTAQSETEIQFQSRTTGDLDGIDLHLDDATSATLTLECGEGTFTTPATEAQTWDLGDLDRRVTITPYPESPTQTHLTLNQAVTPPPNTRTPYFIKLTQTDGHQAWSSPIYIE